MPTNWKATVIFQAFWKATLNFQSYATFIFLIFFSLHPHPQINFFPQSLRAFSLTLPLLPFLSPFPPSPLPLPFPFKFSYSLPLPLPHSPSHRVVEDIRTRRQQWLEWPCRMVIHQRMEFLSLFLVLICNFCLTFILLFISFIMQNWVFILPLKSINLRKMIFLMILLGFSRFLWSLIHVDSELAIKEKNYFKRKKNINHCSPDRHWLKDLE